LLSYHADDVWNIFKARDLDCRTFCTPWVMTLFAKGTPLDLVYEIFDSYMRENDKLFLLYMVVALIILRKEKIKELATNSDETKLIIYLNRELKEETLVDSERARTFFTLAKKLKAATPHSFETSLKNVGFTETAILSVQEIKDLMADRSGTIFQIYPYEIIHYILHHFLIQTTENMPFYDKDITIKFLDCRKKKSKYLPFTIDIPQKIQTKGNELYNFLLGVTQLERNTHICILLTSEFIAEEKAFCEEVLAILRQQKKNYVSVLFGGFEGVLKEIAKKKVNIPLYSNVKSSNEKKGFFKKLMGKLFKI